MSDAGASSSRASRKGNGASDGDIEIRFPRTDAPDTPRRPTNLEPVVVDGKVNYHKPIGHDEPKNIMWRRTVGQFIAENALGKSAKEAKNYILADFPDGYEFYNHLKGDLANPRTDPYLFGSATVLKFRSTKEFQPHALWLFRGPEAEGETCTCVYCSGENRNKAKQRATDPSPAKTQSSPAGPSAPKARRVGRPSKSSRLAIDTSPNPDHTIADASPVSTPSKKVGRPPAGPTRAVDPARHADLEYWETRRYRENELVWALLDPPIQGPEPWQRIELWPALVKRQSVDREAGENGSVGETGTACIVMYLASSQTEKVASVDIAPFLAYAVPVGFFNWLMVQDLPPELRDELYKLDTFQPQASKATHDMPVPPPKPTFENAYPSYALALMLAGEIFQKWSISDPYEADREWYLDFRLTPPRKFRNPGEVFTAKFVDFTLLQGMFLGAERIWQNDLVRLNTPWANLQGISREPTPGSATRGLFYEIRWILRKKVTKEDREIITEGRLYELVPENTPDDIDKEDPPPSTTPVVPASTPSRPSVLPAVPDAPNGHATPATPNAPAAGTSIASQDVTTSPSAPMMANGAAASGATATADARAAENGHELKRSRSQILAQQMKRLLLAQAPIRQKDGTLSFEYPLPQAPPGFKFRCLHKPGTIGVTVGPLAIAGRYYRHLLVESSRLQRILGDPSRNGIGSDQIQSLAGALPGQLCAMMPADYISNGRGMTFFEAEKAAKRALAERWNLSTDAFVYRFSPREAQPAKRRYDAIMVAESATQPQEAAARTEDSNARASEPAVPVAEDTVAPAAESEQHEPVPASRNADITMTDADATDDDLPDPVPEPPTAPLADPEDVQAQPHVLGVQLQVPEYQPQVFEAEGHASESEAQMVDAHMLASEHEGEVHDAEPSGPATAENVEPAGHVEARVDVEATADVEAAADVENTRDIEDVADAEVTADAEAAADVETTGDIEETADVETTADTEAADQHMQPHTEEHQQEDDERFSEPDDLFGD